MYDGGYGRRGMIVQPPVGEKRIFNWVNEYCIPLAQAATVGVIVGYTVLFSPFVAILSAGDAALFLFTGVWMLITFIWYFWRSARLVTEDNMPIVEQYGDDVFNTLSWLEIAAGVGMSLLAGCVSICIYGVMVMLNLTRPEWLTGWIALVGIAQFPMFVVFSIFLVTSFGQELIQRSPHQEMFVWQAIGELIKNLGGHWLRDLMNPREPVLIRERQQNGNSISPQITPRPQMTEEEEDAAMMVEFIARGAQIGYTRSAWTGRNGVVMESTGTVMKQREWVEITERLTQAGILRDGKTAELTCTVDEAIASISHPSLQA